jgi:ADP-ribosylglycohydrolase
VVNREEALALAAPWIAERGAEFRIDEDSVFRTRDGWEIGYAVPSEDGRVRSGGRWPKQGVEVHVLGTTSVIEDGNVRDRPWEARFDPELITLPGMRTDPNFTAVAGWVAKDGGEFHANPAHVPGPLASGDPVPLTPMERFLDYLDRGWYQLDQLGHNGLHGEVLIPGEVSATRFDFPDVQPVFTRPELLPDGTTAWTRVGLNTFVTKVFSRDFSGTRPVKLHINPGHRHDTELDLRTFPDEAAQHLRMCDCGRYGRFVVEHSPWLSSADIQALKRIASVPPVDVVPVRTLKIEFTLGMDDQGRRFLVREPEPKQDDGKLRGCLIGGAIGDALGANTENLPMEVVYERHGPDGITDLPDDPAITDDTQMTLFTFEAAIRAHVRKRTTGGSADYLAAVQHAYQRWLHTQKTPWEKARGPLSTLDEPDGWLIGHRDLFRMRAPGLTVTSALQQYARTGVMATSSNPANNSKGCGGAMRVAPVAFFAEDASQAFLLAKCTAELTHGHPSGYLSAGFFAVLIYEALQGKGLLEGVDSAMKEIVWHEDHEEVVAAVEHAIELAALGDPSVARVEELGRGGVGDTALAIALYSALVTDDPNEALLISVNHGGDNDSTASMCGNLVGALHGVGRIRPDWVERVQFREVIDQMVEDWAAETGPNPPTAQEWFTRYPPS